MLNELTVFSDDVKNKFRTLYLEGQEVKQINESLEINQNTWDGYVYQNKYGLRDWYNELKKERTMRTCEAFSKKLMSKEAEDNAKMLAIQQKEAEFLRETLLKDTYSKRIETIGFNVNKNEPLDDEQKARLDKLLKKSGVRVKEVEFHAVNTDQTMPSPTPETREGEMSQTTEI
jgi:hypothetical protein